MRHEHPELTHLLSAWRDGDGSALDDLIPLVVEELRVLANHHVRRLGSTPTLQPTAIINEAFIRLSRKQRAVFPSRAHFFAFASKLIRDLLIDHLRRHQAARRGAGAEILPLPAADQVPAPTLRTDTALAIHQLLSVLEQRDPRRGQVVELRYFGGLTMSEIAEVTGRSVATVERDWQVARRWLAAELSAPSD
ncbi:MAG: ECF-type sigma factor [Acidobacteriota bacterium]